MILRAVAVWLVILVVAVVNGAVRETLVSPRFGAAAGHIASSIALSAAAMLVAWLTIAWIAPASAGAAWATGGLWLLLTVAFEFLAGHYLFGDPWEKLLADYDLRRGRIWVLVLVATTCAPAFGYWLRAP